MAKRFTDTGKWKKEFIKGLSPKMKLLWFYILDDCDHAGIWEVDLEVAGLRIGEPVTYREAFLALGQKITTISKNKWFIADFIFFQYGELSDKNRMHQSVIGVLNKYNIQINKGHVSPFQGVKDKDKEQEKEKDKEQEKEGSAELKIVPRETIDERLADALDEIYIEQQRMKWSHIDFDLELFAFVEKVRGSPEHYKNHDTGGIRQAFIYQLKSAKKKSDGKSFNKNDRTQQNQNDIALILQHASGGSNS